MKLNLGFIGDNKGAQRELRDPCNRNHKSLAIANRNFEVASLSRRSRSKIVVLQSVFGIAVILLSCDCSR